MTGLGKAMVDEDGDLGHAVLLCARGQVMDLPEEKTPSQWDEDRAHPCTRS